MEGRKIGGEKLGAKIFRPYAHQFEDGILYQDCEYFVGADWIRPIPRPRLTRWVFGPIEPQGIGRRGFLVRPVVIIRQQMGEDAILNAAQYALD